MDSNVELAEKLNTAWKFFYGRGYIDGFGHISTRTAQPDRLLVAPHSLGPDSQPSDFVLVDLDGKQIDSEVKLPSELPIHLDVYQQRPDVGSVAHFHCHYTTSFSMTDHALRPSYFLASIFRDGIPVHPDPSLVNSRERGAALAKTLGSHRVAIMKAHGVVITGADIVEMVGTAYILEDNAHRTWLSAAVGKAEFLDEATMERIEGEILSSRGPFRRIWALCEAEANG